jgi:hypothetical protein
MKFFKNIKREIFIKGVSEARWTTVLLVYPDGL